MSRRERTTALPRQRPRATRRETSRRFAGIEWTESKLRALIIGAGGLGVFLVVFGFGYIIYDQQVGRPNQVVLDVGDDEVKLSYYADRLYPWILENQQSGLGAALLETQLLSKLETELLTEQLAEKRGIQITDQDVNQGIAEALGIAGAASGNSFDTLYRQELETQKMSDSNYRRMVHASIANDRLLELFKGEVGAEGEQLELRTIVVTPDASAGNPTQDARDRAQALLDRINAGEDMGTIAQTESADLTSRQQDGLMQPEPAELLPQALADALAGKAPGDLVGPIEVAGDTSTAFWIVRIERKETIAYSDAQKDQLAQIRLDDAIAQERTATEITRDLDSDDIEWAEGQLN
ncbi:MAG: SurA N-terminal domain-containing protein [Dehalococcoidia bacterium]|nr:SurA N-terminal domain-containing protein [Dehalococcoidia bacterium]